MLKKIALLLVVLLLFAGCDEQMKEEKTAVREDIQQQNENVSVEPEVTPTAKPTPEPIKEEIKAEVRTKTEYTKEVIVPEHYKDMDYKFKPHTIYVPEIVDDSDAVNELNDEIYQICKKYIDMLENNSEGEYLVDVSYTHTEKDGVFGILLIFRDGVMFSEWWSTYLFFYYDSVENKVLTEDEYYLSMGSTKDEIWDRIQSSPEFIMEQDFYTGASLDMAIFDDEVILAVVNTPDGFQENTYVQTVR